MVSVEDAVIARITKQGITFEILVDPEKALEFKKGKPYSIENILAVNQIFKDSRKGERVSSSDLQKAFQSIDIFAISAIIIKEGDVQLTTDQRRKMTEAKRNEIASLISRQGVDPKTHIPHPMQRILNAMAEAHVDIDPFKSANDQLPQVINRLQPIIPISFEKATIGIKVPVDAAGKISHSIREFGSIEKEEWTPTSWVVVMTISAGMQTALNDKVNNLTAGRAEIKVIKRESL